MKPRFLFTTAILLIMLFTVSGCSSSGSQSLNSVLKILPDDVYFVISVDWDKLRSDPNLSVIYDGLMDDFGTDTMEENVGINLSDISLMTVARNNGTRWLILDGNFDFDDIRHAFENQDMDVGEYRGIEFWQGKDTAAAFINGMLVITMYYDDLKDAILLSDGTGDSFYDNEYNQIVINELPAGVVTYFTNQETYEPRAIGTSIYVSSTDTMEYIICHVFSSEEDAYSNLADIEDEIEHSLSVHIFDVSQSGNMVNVKGETDINNFNVSNLFYLLAS